MNVPRLIAPAMAAGWFAGSGQPEIVVRPAVVLRPWRLGDAAAVLAAFTDPDIQRWHVRRADSLEEAVEWITDRQRAAGLLSPSSIGR